MLIFSGGYPFEPPVLIAHQSSASVSSEREEITGPLSTHPSVFVNPRDGQPPEIRFCMPNLGVDWNPTTTALEIVYQLRWIFDDTPACRLEHLQLLPSDWPKIASGFAPFPHPLHVGQHVQARVSKLHKWEDAVVSRISHPGNIQLKLSNSDQVIDSSHDPEQIRTPSTIFTEWEVVPDADLFVMTPIVKSFVFGRIKDKTARNAR